MIYKENYIQTLNVSRRTIIPIGAVVHHITLNVEDTIKILTQRGGVLSNGDGFLGVSAHCVGWRNGDRTVLAADNARTWHAGVSEFMGRSNCNDFMLGYEFHGDTYAQPLTQEQIGCFVDWFIPRKEKWNIAFNYVTDHRTVAPHRKVDINPVELEKLLKVVKQLYI